MKSPPHWRNSSVKCDLCRHEETLRDHLLCASCAEMVQRLITVENRLRQSQNAASSRSTSAGFAAAGSLA